MEKRNTLLLTVIAIATLLVAVVGATFAYFASESDVDAKVPVNVTTSGKTASFSAVADQALEISVDANKMQQADAPEDGNLQSNVTTIAENLTGNTTLTVSLYAGNDGRESKCTYDIIYTWTSNQYGFDSDGKATEEAASIVGDKAFYHPTEGVTKEFTISATATGTTYKEGATDNKDTYTITGASSVAEANIIGDPANLTKKDGADEYYYTLVSGAEITSSSTTVPTEVVWEFTGKFYNSVKDQSKLMGRGFTGTISVDPTSVHC